ncbi:hypothetical protein H109_02793 [Trichophyton interdigitale MR816]|uniref:Uncharacterized protein n=1 Tax=Trichophyton interdigitale (strain MR816) TaxID=1215338 RepID=A0A059JC56_TRIIM|nr:hypothetical protein H109_02793 [Trichophyton interdigitale MR816]
MIQTTFPKCLWDLPFVNRGVSGITFAVDELSVIKTPTGGEENAEELRVERKILERPWRPPADSETVIYL